MKPDLNALVVFAKVVDTGSFSKAARVLEMPLSTVSRRVADLEDALGVRLLERSTRRLSVTHAGSEVLEQARTVLAASEALEAIVSDKRAAVSGIVRVSAPPSVSDTLITPLICAFQQSYPDVSVQIFVTDRMVDLISEGMDLVFRLGALKDSSLVAVRLLSYRHMLVASPDYLQRMPMPRTPDELLKHRLFAFSHGPGSIRWTLKQTSGSETRTVVFMPAVAMNDYAGLTAALLAGGGIGDLPPVVQPELLRKTKLVEVMPDWRFRTFDLSLVHLGNRHIARPVRLFKELAVRMTPELFPSLPD
jgi:DNA-binding transcriptional LysR family regulator